MKLNAIFIEVKTEKIISMFSFSRQQHNSGKQREKQKNDTI